MKLKHIAVLVVVAAASAMPDSARAIQKHDPIFRTVYSTIPQKNDPDLVRQLQNQNGTPHSKVDLFVARATGPATDRNLVREIRDQNGSPRSKVDPSLRPLAPAPSK
jgi:hypothetical protein